jgi:hypothetical protein
MAVPANRAALELLIRTQGRVIDTGGGGNCLFSSVQEALTNAGLMTRGRYTVDDVRQVAVNELLRMIRNGFPFAGNVIPGQGPNVINNPRYANLMRQNGTWGGVPEIAALASAYHVRIVTVGGTPYTVLHEFGNPANRTIFIYMSGANRGRETHWQALVTTPAPGPSRFTRASGIINSIFEALRQKKPAAAPAAPKPSGKFVNSENVANAIIAGLVNKPAVSNLGSPANRNGYARAGVLVWLGKQGAYVYGKDGNFYVYVKSLGKFAQRFGKWRIAPVSDGVFTLVWDDTIVITNRRHAAAAGAAAAVVGHRVANSIHLNANISNAFVNGYMLARKGPVPPGFFSGLKLPSRGPPGSAAPRPPPVNKAEVAKELGKALGKNVSANNIAKAITNGINSILNPKLEEEEEPGKATGGPSILNKLKNKLTGAGAGAGAGGRPNNMNTLIKIYQPILASSSKFWEYYNKIKNYMDEKLADDLYGIFVYMNSLNRNYNKTISNNKDGKTSVKTVLRDLAMKRIKYIIEDPKTSSDFRYELVGNYKSKIFRLQKYGEIPDGQIQREVKYHLDRFRLSQKTGVRRPLRNTSGYGYGGGGGYEGAIYGANRNYSRYMAARRPSRFNNEGRKRNNRNRLERMLRERGLSENAIRRLGEKGGEPSSEYEKYKTTSGENRAEYNALKKLTQPQVPTAPVELPPLPGVSAKTEESILKHLTPTQQIAVNKAGNLAAVNRILKAAGGTDKVGQAAEILKQVPKNEALKLHLVSKKAAAAVDLFGGPNKAEAAVKVNKKIMSARKKKKGSPKKKKTAVKTKVMKKPAPVSPLRTKVLKNVIAQVPKEKLIDIAGKTTLGIYKARTPKKVVVNDFARFVERKPKPQPPAKKKAAGPRPQPKAKPSKIKKTKAKK